MVLGFAYRDIMGDEISRNAKRGNASPLIFESVMGGVYFASRSFVPRKKIHLRR
jgi:hypothetical protein